MTRWCIHDSVQYAGMSEYKIKIISYSYYRYKHEQGNDEGFSLFSLKEAIDK